MSLSPTVFNEKKDLARFISPISVQPSLELLKQDFLEIIANYAGLSILL